MDKLVVEGGKALKGNISVSGAKNAVLPMMACTFLAEGQYRLDNVPMLKDVKTMSKLLENMGADVSLKENSIAIKTNGHTKLEAPYELVKTMRASIYVLGPLLARHGYAKVSLPGGCAWGPRPVNLHIEGMRKMGADIKIEKGYIIAKARRLKGAHISFDIPSVGATGNLLMAATLAKGRTIIENAAKEPEISATAKFLNAMGAKIEGIGTDQLIIDGTDSLHPADESVIADRIEAGTFMIAALITGGDITLENVDPHHVAAISTKMADAGAIVTEGPNWINIHSKGRIKPVDMTTAVYPGFPTDMQAQWMALMSIAKGSSIITDSVFLDRFTHVAELKRLGADITLDHNVAVIKGTSHLSGAPVMSTDLRASASLILAGLVAKGQTDVSRVYHIDRGYEKIEKKLQGLGAKIWRTNEQLIT
ncbi:UDP-N-acetylglucosamine 1-carboxyvinyltransferase [bacterium]|nr:UDP-N-acetylglucosamine 1-carboxyvinyltransferase [bacterium]